MSLRYETSAEFAKTSVRSHGKNVGFANFENFLYLVDYAEDRGGGAASTARRARRSWRTFRFRSDSLVDAGPLFTRETAQLMGNLSRARLPRSYPFRDPDRLVVMSETEPANVRSERTVIPGNCRHLLRLKHGSLEDAAIEMRPAIRPAKRYESRKDHRYRPSAARSTPF